MLIGTHNHGIDAKGRMFLPSKMRYEFGDTVYLVKGIDPCITVYPIKAWEEFYAKLDGLPQTEARKIKRFLFASAPFTFSKEREFVFGLTVTPVKPLNRKLLRQRDKKDWQLYEPWKHFNYLHPENIKTEVPFRNMQNFYSQHRMFPVLFFYTAYNFTGPFSPFWTWYEEDWRQIKHNRNYGTWTGTKPHAYCEGCINGADYRNFRLNNLNDFLTRKNNPLLIPGTKNLYFDAPWEESCYNTKHGCTLWKDSLGVLRTHILVDVFRDKALNIWRMIKRVSPESLEIGRAHV